MKRLLVITALFSVGVLIFSMVFDAYASSSPETKRDQFSINLDNEIDFMPKAIRSGEMVAPVICAYVKIAPVFDVTGSVNSDPTGKLLIGNQPKNMVIPVTCPDAKIAPVFDATGAVVSDPTGTILNGNLSVDMPVLAPDSDVKIAPVFDDTGMIVSDPTGTILSVVNR